MGMGIDMDMEIDTDMRTSSHDIAHPSHPSMIVLCTRGMCIARTCPASRTCSSRFRCCGSSVLSGKMGARMRRQRSWYVSTEDGSGNNQDGEAEQQHQHAAHTWDRSGSHGMSLPHVLVHDACSRTILTSCRWCHDGFLQHTMRVRARAGWWVGGSRWSRGGCSGCRRKQFYSEQHMTDETCPQRDTSRIHPSGVAHPSIRHDPTYQ